ncbi:uncharacterized protein LOC114301777 isoform X3 [Camellia sinensis]|uniref:uncharacterized protein LOC114301777 isoform X3 n=1 Tax=Camellia sinensis TaxID=4442 RepID=UPI0010358050|nr:uncharacterized protein LOC114301777 isoform X3 [Camellia sinensis]
MPLCGSLLINITKFSRFPLCFTLTLTLSAYGFCIRAQCLSRFWDHLSQFDQASLSLSYEWKQGKRRLKDKSLNLSIPGITVLEGKPWHFGGKLMVLKRWDYRNLLEGKSNKSPCLG